MITLNCCFLYKNDDNGYIDNDMVSIGLIVFSGVVVAVNVKVLLRVCIIDYILIIFLIASVGALYFIIFILSTTKYRFIWNYIDIILKEFSYEDLSNLYGTNDYLIDKKKYFVYFLFVVFFVCFLDIAANRINFKYVKNIFNENKSFLLFDTNKYLLDGVNNGVFNDDYEKENNNVIDDDCELLKKNNINKDLISTSINENDKDNILI